MSILNLREKKISYTYKMPQWLYDNLVRDARGENLNDHISRIILEARPQLSKKENTALKKILQIGQKQAVQ